MPRGPKVKRNLYFPEDLVGEIKEESKRLDRSLSWLVNRAWEISRRKIAQFPAPLHIDDSGRVTPYPYYQQDGGYGKKE